MDVVQFGMAMKFRLPLFESHNLFLNKSKWIVYDNANKKQQQLENHTN